MEIVPVRLVGGTGILALLMACSEPVKRDLTPPPPPEVEAKPNYQMPDLKKRIWVLRFEEPTTPPPSLKKMDVPELIQAEIRKALGGEKSPYLAQTDEDERAFVGFHFDELKDPTEVARRLRGSDVAGFLTGKISQLEVTEVGDDNPGLLKSKTMMFRVGIEYEVWDTNTGRKISSGKESQNYSETRSDFLGVQAQLPELPKKLNEMSRELGKKILRKLLPLAEKLAWSGRVLRIEGGRIYINSGRLTGIMVGDVLKVIEAPKEIQDPQSGGFVGSAPGRMKATVKVLQYFGNDGAIAVLQSGGGIYPGDRVELY